MGPTVLAARKPRRINDDSMKQFKGFILRFSAAFFSCWMILLCPLTEVSYTNDLSVSHINPELLVGANAVVRLDERTFQYHEPGSGQMLVRRIVTILNSDGLSHASLEIPYHSFTKIKKLGGAVYNSAGDRVDKIRGRHFDDESRVSAISIAEDSRIKKGRFTHSEYPFTVEIEYRIDYSGFIQLPAWTPVNREKTAIEEGSLTVQLPRDAQIDFRTFNVPDENFSQTASNENRSYRWEITGMNGIEREPFGPPWFELLPAVVFRTNEFQMDGYAGNLEEWSSFASWIGYLWQGRTELPQVVKGEIDRMVDIHGQSHELIQAIYTFLQENTRYVSIQLGIGGFQTETARSTAENRYGDCKALSNYLVAMLRYAGVEAYPALIRNGGFSFPFDTEFVHNPFNHSVVTIPFQNDTLWVEATSSSFPAGYLGASNSNRHALVFHNNGGKLVETPLLKPEDNFQKRSATVKLLENGDATASVSTQLGGSQHESVRSVSRQAQRRQRQFLDDRLPFNLYDISSYQIEAGEAKPVASIAMDIKITSYATVVGNRIMFSPNLVERTRGYLTPPRVRSQPLHTGDSYHDVDSISIEIPENYTVEAIPEPVSLEFEFGSYSSRVSVADDGKSLNYSRELLMEPGVLPVGDVSQFYSFINDFVRSDNSQAVLVKI